MEQSGDIEKMITHISVEKSVEKSLKKGDSGHDRFSVDSINTRVGRLIRSAISCRYFDAVDREIGGRHLRGES